MTNTVNYHNIVDQLDFKDSVFPRVVQNQQKLSNLTQCTTWVEKNLKEFEDELTKSGALLFRGFPIDSAESFDVFSAAFGYKNFTYKESLSNAVRINFTERVFTANEAPSDVEIYLHHEMAQTPISPDKLFFFCKSAAERGGATPICRSDQLYAALAEQEPSLANDFLNKGLKYTTHMPANDDHQSGQGRSWQSTLSVESKKQAEQKLIDLGYSWEWNNDGGLKAITPVLPAVKVLQNGVHVFYNQVIAAYMGWGIRDNPAKAITFGDGSIIPVAGLDKIVTLAANYTYDLKWQDGDIVLLDNKMTMHGRRPFQGQRKRQVLVALAA